MISDCVSLSDKLGRKMRTLISEDRAVDAILTAVVDELAPDEKSVCVSCSKDDAFSGSDELRALSAIAVMIA